MKIAVISFSGNVGKTTVARHLLAPRIPGAQVVSVESINADEGQEAAIKGKQFGELQEFMQTVDDLVVDVGASNVEDLLRLMERFHGSHEDFDLFVIPAVPARKQQQDTVATIGELHRLGVPGARVRVVFNQLESTVPDEVRATFAPVFAFAEQFPDFVTIDPNAAMSTNEVYQRAKAAGATIAELAADTTDFKALIAAASDSDEKVALASRLGTQRLARGVTAELDRCFAAVMPHE